MAQLAGVQADQAEFAQRRPGDRAVMPHISASMPHWL
jgi:hypothetical protein